MRKLNKWLIGYMIAMLFLMPLIGYGLAVSSMHSLAAVYIMIVVALWPMIALSIREIISR